MLTSGRSHISIATFPVPSDDPASVGNLQHKIASCPLKVAVKEVSPFHPVFCASQLCRCRSGIHPTKTMLVVGGALRVSMFAVRWKKEIWAMLARQFLVFCSYASWL